MANTLYNRAREGFLEKEIQWTVDTIKVDLVDNADYTANPSSDDFHDDIPGGAIESTGTLGGKTATAGVADANDVTLTAVTGDPCESLVIWQDTATPATSLLIAYIDTATGLPVTPNGGDISVQWDSGANRIFRI